MNTLASLFSQGLEQLSLSVSTRAQEQCLAFLEKMLETNQRLNLTAIKDPKDAVVKHLMDSLASLQLDCLQDARPEAWMDLGTGPGVPGIPLAVARPEITMHLVDSTQKKAAYLEQVCRELSLESRVQIHAERSETLARGPLREKLQVVFARALGSLPTIIELALPFLEDGGVLVAYKGPKVEGEIKEASTALKKLKGEVVDVVHFSLPVLQEPRSFVVIKKNGKIPSDFPRLAGTPAKDPLL